MPGGQVTVSTSCAADPRAVYEVLADISTHRAWAGEQQVSAFHIIELDNAPPGRVDVGSTWSSVGTLPMNRHGWHDHSRVTVADGPQRFEYVTEARIPRSGGKADREATYRHRYDICPEGDSGSRVSYTITEERTVDPLLRFALPGVRQVALRVGVRYMAWRGLRNIAKMAERLATGKANGVEEAL